MMPGAPTALRIAVSACLVGEPVRYDGQEKSCAGVTGGLAAFAELVPLCPEVGAGMAVPREAVDLFGDPSSPRMIGVVTGEDWTAALFAEPGAAAARADGLLAAAIRRRFPHLPLVGDEGLDVVAFVARARAS